MNTLAYSKIKHLCRIKSKYLKIGEGRSNRSEQSLEDKVGYEGWDASLRRVKWDH